MKIGVGTVILRLRASMVCSPSCGAYRSEDFLKLNYFNFILLDFIVV